MKQRVQAIAESIYEVRRIHERLVQIAEDLMELDHDVKPLNTAINALRKVRGDFVDPPLSVPSGRPDPAAGKKISAALDWLDS